MTTRLPARDDVALMEGYHSPQLDVDVRLNTNESPVGPPQEMVARLAEALENVAWNRYPDREARDLRAAIAGLHGVDADRIHAANGSNEVLQTLLLAFGGPGRRALVFEPTYALHSHISRLTGTEVVVEQRDDSFGLDAATVAAAVDAHRPAITFLCSPNNPTGGVDAPQVVAAAIDRVTETGGLLCVDEAYGQFASHSACEQAGAGIPLVVTRTYSKTWALAAARLGYAVAPEWVVAELAKVALPYHLDTVSQLVGLIALDFHDEMTQRIAALVAERERVAASLGELDVDVWPSGANFVLFRPRTVPGRDVWRSLVERSVLVRDCSSWPRLDGCLRVTVGTVTENDRFLTALEEVLP